MVVTQSGEEAALLHLDGIGYAMLPLLDIQSNAIGRAWLDAYTRKGLGQLMSIPWRCVSSLDDLPRVFRRAQRVLPRVFRRAQRVERVSQRVEHQPSTATGTADAHVAPSEDALLQLRPLPATPATDEAWWASHVSDELEADRVKRKRQLEYLNVKLSFRKALALHQVCVCSSSRTRLQVAVLQTPMHTFSCSR